MNLFRRRRQLTDDRGAAAVLYVDRRPIATPPQRNSPHGRELSRQLMRVMFGPYYVFVMPMMAYGIGAGLALPWLMQPVLHWSRNAGLPLIAVGVGIGVLYGAVVFGLPLWWFMARRRQRILRAVRDCWFCPSCLYDLRGLGVQDDGCTVCPECGAAWRLSSGAVDGTA